MAWCARAPQQLTPPAIAARFTLISSNLTLMKVKCALVTPAFCEDLLLTKGQTSSYCWKHAHCSGQVRADTLLSRNCQFDFPRRSIAQGRVESAAVVLHLDVFDHVSPCRLARPVSLICYGPAHELAVVDIQNRCQIEPANVQIAVISANQTRFGEVAMNWRFSRLGATGIVSAACGLLLAGL